MFYICSSYVAVAQGNIENLQEKCFPEFEIKDPPW